MRWRTLLASMLGLLMTLPLAWLFYIAMFGQGVNEPRAQGKVPVPMLSPEERRSLLTYGHDCKTDGDCEPPLRCFFSTHTMSHYCSDSRCVTDMQCQEGFTCRTQTTTSGDPIRVCSLVGMRKEGEICMKHSPANDYACEQGLLCQGRCGRPCRLDDPASCPEGYFCHDGAEDEPSCLPTCEGRTCAEGQHCVTLDGTGSEGRHASICARVYGQDCQQNPCPQGQFCMLQTAPQPVDAVWMQCTLGCGAGAPPCPEGTVCHQYRCQKPCAPEDPSSCEPGFTCHRKTDKEPWRCVPFPRASSQTSP
ncbi:hypothetical protein [Vitiosangium sp. GDMCC 1.1324]|uniref:hypothetical protein n=1 Tax=Vitiosangium sp. (strain GDMCC 1.1324) TaxID=2138576 RepID=UPI000D398C2C|nr:hypothetical protein [Vitiosangium sp. GDMCC 1.1324]PTL83302.1 hypothetical protein DAT35_15040 [Vitiosangium sp. GDMCC 1.1324]